MSAFSSRMRQNAHHPVLPQVSLHKSLDSQKNSLDREKIYIFSILASKFVVYLKCFNCLLYCLNLFIICKCVKIDFAEAWKISYQQCLGFSQELRTAPRGVTRLDGARGKKQVWRPHVHIWGLSEANVLYCRKYLWHCWGFLAPFAVIRRPENFPPPCPPGYAPDGATCGVFRAINSTFN